MSKSNVASFELLVRVSVGPIVPPDVPRLDELIRRHLGSGGQTRLSLEAIEWEQGQTDAVFVFRLSGVVLPENATPEDYRDAVHRPPLEVVQEALRGFDSNIAATVQRSSLWVSGERLRRLRHSSREDKEARYRTVIEIVGLGTDELERVKTEVARLLDSSRLVSEGDVWGDRSTLAIRFEIAALNPDDAGERALDYVDDLLEFARAKSDIRLHILELDLAGRRRRH